LGPLVQVLGPIGLQASGYRLQERHQWGVMATPAQFTMASSTLQFKA
jgi:hypothetical protein